MKSVVGSQLEAGKERRGVAVFLGKEKRVSEMKEVERADARAHPGIFTNAY